MTDLILNEIFSILCGSQECGARQLRVQDFLDEKRQPKPILAIFFCERNH